MAACYDLEGNRRWIRVDHAPPSSTGSLLAAVDRRQVRGLHVRSAGLRRPDRRVAWKSPLVEADGLNPQGFFHGSLVAATIGGRP